MNVTQTMKRKIYEEKKNNIIANNNAIASANSCMRVCVGNVSEQCYAQMANPTNTMVCV